MKTVCFEYLQRFYFIYLTNNNKLNSIHFYFMYMLRNKDVIVHVEIFLTPWQVLLLLRITFTQLFRSEFISPPKSLR